MTLLPALVTPFPVNIFPSIEAPKVSNNILRNPPHCLFSCFSVSLTQSIHQNFPMILKF